MTKKIFTFKNCYSLQYRHLVYRLKESLFNQYTREEIINILRVNKSHVGSRITKHAAIEQFFEILMNSEFLVPKSSTDEANKSEFVNSLRKEDTEFVATIEKIREEQKASVKLVEFFQQENYNTMLVKMNEMTKHLQDDSSTSNSTGLDVNIAKNAVTTLQLKVKELQQELNGLQVLIQEKEEKTNL